MAIAKWSIVGVTAALCSVASAQDDRDKMLEASYAQVKAARNLMFEGKNAEAERILLIAKQTHDQLKASFFSGGAYLAYLYLLQGRNDEALRAMIFKPGKHSLHSHLAAVAYARLHDGSRSRFMLVMPLDSDEYLKQTFGGRANLPADETFEGSEALAWLLLAGQSSIGERFIRARAAEEAHRLAPENPAVQYWMGVRMVWKGDEEGARGYFLAAEATGSEELRGMARHQLEDLPDKSSAPR